MVTASDTGLPIDEPAPNTSKTPKINNILFIFFNDYITGSMKRTINMRKISYRSENPKIIDSATINQVEY